MYIFVVGFSNLRRMNENVNKITSRMNGKNMNKKTCVEWLENVNQIPIKGTIFYIINSETKIFFNRPY